MTQAEFLSSLKKELYLKRNKQETLEILQDYCEYFQDALAEGKTEVEICAALELPKEIVRELDANSPPEKKVPLQAFGGVALLIASLFFLFFDTVQGLWVSLAFVVVVPALLWLCIASNRKQEILAASKKLQKRLWLVAGAQGLLLLVCTALIMNIQARLEIVMAFVEAAEVGPNVVLFLRACGVLCLAGWWGQFVSAAKGRMEAMPWFCFSGGVVGSLFALIEVLHGLESAAAMQRAVLLALLPCLAGLALTAVCLWVQRRIAPNEVL